MPDAAKGVEEAYIGLPNIPCLVRRLAVDALCEGAVEDENGHEYGLPPIRDRPLLCLEHAACHPEHRLVPPLDDAILLRRVRGCEVTLHPFLVAVLVERGRRDLAAMVRARHAQLVAALDLCCRLLLDDGSLHLILGGEEQHPHEPAIVVDEQQDVATPSWRCWGD